MRVPCRASLAGLALVGFGVGGCAGEREQAVAPRGVPQGVRATLEREAAPERLVYSFDVRRVGGAWDVCIAEGGTPVEERLDTPTGR